MTAPEGSLTALRETLLAVGWNHNQILDTGLVPAACAALRRLHGERDTARAELVDSRRANRAPSRDLWGAHPLDADVAARLVVPRQGGR